jgi:MFS family permease
MTRDEVPIGTERVPMRLFVLAWICCTAFYFLEYGIRSAPAVMIPELAKHFGASTLGVSSIIGTYYYTYATTSLVAGVLLDRFGAKYVIPIGMCILSWGCLVFALPHPLAGDIGRLMQGSGSAFAFTGAVYLAAHGLPAQRLATAIGLTQCVGMLGGSAGQLVAGPLINGVMSAPTFWSLSGLIVLVVAIALLLVTPTERSADGAGPSITKILEPYSTVFSNPQSYLCGLVAGLLFAPTTVLDMVWGVRYLEQDFSFGHFAAVFATSMVPLGWVVGCPLLGWIADYFRRRKPALIGGALLMLACILQLTLLPNAMPTWVTLFTFGIGSGAAMIPYTIIKEVNPDRVKGSATGAMNFLTFSITAVIGPIFAYDLGKTLATTTDHAAHLRHTHLFWISVVVLALLSSTLLKETGALSEQERQKLQR